MVTNKRLKFWARQIEIAHIIVSILVIASVIAVFVSEKFKVIPALFIIFVFLVQQIYGLCPLTRLENILLRLSGVDVKKRNFMPRFYKKYFHIKIPEWLAEFAMLLFFVLAIVVLTRYFCGC